MNKRPKNITSIDKNNFFKDLEEFPQQISYILNNKDMFERLHKEFGSSFNNHLSKVSKDWFCNSDIPSADDFLVWMTSNGYLSASSKLHAECKASSIISEYARLLSM